MSEPFQKNDQGKIRMDLILPEFLEGLAGVLTHGATKYSPDNWKNCDAPFERYYAALQRHLVAYAKGDDIDPESGYHHLYHAGACLMFLSYFQPNKQYQALTQLTRETEAMGGYALEETDTPYSPTMMLYRPLPHQAGE